MSSTQAAAAETMDSCASCGTTAIDDVKLKKCACKLVQYCSVDCQKNHRPQHKRLCRKRMDELRDERLLEQPDSSCYGDCPICYLPLSLEPKKSNMTACCSKVICNGCSYTNQKREFEAGLERKCAFCREPLPETQEELHKMVMKRVKKNDPDAMRERGRQLCRRGDYNAALEYWTKAAELGDAKAHYELSCTYRDGVGVEKDEKKAFYHTEEAAIAGHPMARHNLGCEEGNKKCRFDRAKKHFIIAANLGFRESLNCLKKLYADGHASKEEYAGALRAYQVAVEATKSLAREKAEEAFKSGEATMTKYGNSLID